VVDKGQVRALGDAVFYARKFMDGERTMAEVIAKVAEEMKEKGLDVLSLFPHGEYVFFRPLELAAALNRLRTLLCQSKK